RLLLLRGRRRTTPWAAARASRTTWPTPPAAAGGARIRLRHVADQFDRTDPQLFAVLEDVVRRARQRAKAVGNRADLHSVEFGVRSPPGGRRQAGPRPPVFRNLDV